MDWTQFVILFITFIGLFIWNRTESRADIRHMDSKLESNRNLSIQIHKENQDIINAIRNDAREFQKAMAQESKDFHGRLCAIEERGKK